eukprot:TRINITY_DN21009_c0_g1_i1.p1 TRINITY_DN21009_c0_g1~~TRINITY_DN21009_c0_g1_i1.p1  ORF type:complete len:1003 (+),score=52.03 TRINITY_DN21009_c0_g1_i1:46-3009(+)
MGASHYMGAPCRAALLLLLLLVHMGAAYIHTCGAVDVAVGVGAIEVCALPAWSALPARPVAVTHIEILVEGNVAMGTVCADNNADLLLTVTGMGSELITPATVWEPAREFSFAAPPMGTPVGVASEYMPANDQGVTLNSEAIAYVTDLVVAAPEFKVHVENTGDANCNARVLSTIVSFCDLGKKGKDCDACDVGFDDATGCSTCGADFKGIPFTGTRCEPCTSADCSNHGTATSVAGSAACSCQCDPGWEVVSACAVCQVGHEGPDCLTCQEGYKGDPGAAQPVLCTACERADCNGRGTATSVAGATTCTCACDDVGFDPAVACSACLAGYVLDESNACVLIACNLTTDCNDRADHVSFNFTTFKCDCDCSGGYGGRQCDVCGDRFTGAGCTTCMTGYTGTNCAECDARHQRADSGACVLPSCDRGRDCNGNADHVVYNFTTKQCQCDCSTGFDGDQCSQCAREFTGASCNACAPGYTGLPGCTQCDTGYTLRSNGECLAPACDNTADCSGRADHVSFNFTTSTCSCDCSMGFGGLQCERCAVGHVGADCSACLPGYVLTRDVGCISPTCSVISHCSNNADSVQFNEDTSECDCTCQMGYGGDACDRCAPGYIGERCSQCDIGYMERPDRSCVLPSCDNDRDCTGNADHVVYNFTTKSCECTCSKGFAGVRCNWCATRFAGMGCNVCAAGYTVPPDCTQCDTGYSRNGDGQCIAPACDKARDCSDRAARVSFNLSTRRCQCDCLPGIEGEQCERCAAGHVGSDCSQCSAGYIKRQDACVVPTCDLASDCSGNAERVQFNFVTSECQCQCLSDFVGKKCDACAVGRLGADCRQCKVGHTGLNCAACAGGYAKNGNGECVEEALINRGASNGDDDDDEALTVGLIVAFSLTTAFLLAVLVGCYISKSKKKQPQRQDVATFHRDMEGSPIFPGAYIPPSPHRQRAYSTPAPASAPPSPRHTFSKDPFTTPSHARTASYYAAKKSTEVHQL